MTAFKYYFIFHSKKKKHSFTLWSKLEFLSSGVWWVNACWATFHLQKAAVGSFHPQECTHRPLNGCQGDVQGCSDEVAVPDSMDRYDSSRGSQISYFSLDQWISWIAVNSILHSQDHCPYRQLPLPCRWKKNEWMTRNMTNYWSCNALAALTTSGQITVAWRLLSRQELWLHQLSLW